MQNREQQVTTRSVGVPSNRKASLQFDVPLATRPS
jgi:hypothetical protein